MPEDKHSDDASQKTIKWSHHMLTNGFKTNPKEGNRFLQIDVWQKPNMNHVFLSYWCKTSQAVAKKRCMRKNWRKRALVKTEKRAPDRSRAETHANLLVFEWHLHIWTCVFAAVAEGRESAAKCLRKVWVPVFIWFVLNEICTGKHDHKFLCRFFWGMKRRERVAKAPRKGSFGKPKFWTTPK